ncbi:hypothetical protein F8M41_019150 [Gigaspora margarita]|uniref:Uncharacterized protein n=1 Tax=Gigaspora margarita TaxID=4874 RepID=A0A8H4AKA5_GIGMA|nr:hypothetical protein F8M41_019150 [Gigaspora margarita]
MDSANNGQYDLRGCYQYGIGVNKHKKGDKTFQMNNGKFENLPESNSKIGIIKSVDETSNDKNNFEMITTWVDNANKIVHGEVATVINDEEIR